MSQPLRAPPGPSRRAVGQTKTIPAPVGGLNAIDALAAMPEHDCIVCDNFFVQPSYISLRNGYTQYATGFPGWVETILPYSSAAGDKIFGISGTAVYNATAGGAIGAAVVTGLTNARWEYTNVATAGGQFLYAANGVDKPLLYDGSAWIKVDSGTSPAITGVTTTLLRNPVVYKSRVWFVEDGSMRGWFLPTASIGGAASSFDFGPLFRLGGQLQSIIPVSLGDGSTFQQYLAILSSQGEVLLYQGTDPAFASSFGLVGIYAVGKPIGRRNWFQFGDDVIILSSEGFVSLKKMIAAGNVGQSETISEKILNAVNSDVQMFSTHFGWQGVVHPLGNKLIINVPLSENSSQSQYVMNTITNSWCTFGRVNSPWNAATFAVQGNNLYFGGSNYIALADTGTSDNNAAISGLLKTAFSYCGSNRQKFFKAARPLIQTNGTLLVGVNVNTDFTDAIPTNTQESISSPGSPWDTSPWDTSAWAAGLGVQAQWTTVMGVGFSAAFYLAISTASITCNIQALDVIYEVGGVF